LYIDDDDDTPTIGPSLHHPCSTTADRRCEVVVVVAARIPNISIDLYLSYYGASAA
jgi:hypothetical protein